MKTALLICTYNRPEYLRQLFWSLELADLSGINEVLVIDDSSDNQETINLIKDVKIDRPTKIHYKNHNEGIKDSLLIGYEELFKDNDLVINLDSDAVVRPDFVIRLTESYFCGLLTGFHSVTKNANGTDRHKILYKECGLLVKQSVGGINLCINKEAYNKHVKPALQAPVGNWDHMACISAGYAYCLKQSVVQHIGFESSMQHYEQPDTADDFFYWDLPQVTLVGADSDLNRLKQAADRCTKWIRFGDVKLLNPGLASKEAYSEWCIKEMHRYVETSHILVFQHDGYVHNWQAWDNEWLKYDYIGATWWHQDGLNVGNGGFSLRSKKLMEAVSQIALLHHPEDHHICRTYRPQLEKMGFKFAPPEVAEKFSYEGHMKPIPVTINSFGIHGKKAIAKITGIKTGRKYVFNQFRGLGDILFLVPLYRALSDEGNEIIWPIVKEYLPISKHFPDINFVDMDLLDIDYRSMHRIHTKYGELLPYRFAAELTGAGMNKCMIAKYAIYRHDFNMWRNLSWQRDFDAEKRLKKLLGIKGKYQLVNRNFGESSLGLKITPELNQSLPVIEMRPIEGFTLIDWSGIIEEATEIHTANTSLLYLLEIMDLNMPIHFYKRGLWGEQGYEHTDYLYTKDYILH